MLQIGDKVKVTQHFHGHKFDIGEIVTCAHVDDSYEGGGFVREGETEIDQGWMTEEEYVPIKDTETILEEAGRLTSGDRNKAYGHPLDDYTKTGQIWGAMLHDYAKKAAQSDTPIPVPPELACLMMVGVKLSRQVNKSKRDNLVDGCGYFRCVEMIEQEQLKRKESK